MLWMLVASAFAFPVNGNNGAVQHACTAGEKVDVNGNGNTVTLTGDCGRVNVIGNTNTVSIDGLSKLVATGSNNSITWARNLSSKNKLPVSNLGIGNTITKR
jgi:hypothetical protein